MSETEHEDELTEPSVTPVPEPDQEPDDETEEAEAEHGESHDPEAEPEQEAHGPTPEEWEERFKKAERSFATYTRAVSNAWGDDALHLMPFPLDAGAPAGFIDVRNKGRVDDEIKAAALAFLGFDQESGMKPDPYSHLCETCDGYGLTATGSRVTNQDTRRCLDCNGIGYIPEGGPVQASTGNGVSAETTDTGQYVPAAVGPESPEVQSLRMQGYTIIPPMQTSP